MASCFRRRQPAQGARTSITTSEGVRCSQSINSNGGYLDLGVAGGDLNTYYNTYGGTQPSNQAAVGYARVIIPLGKSPKRLDCTRLYEMEIQRLKAEVELLKIGLE